MRSLTIGVIEHPLLELKVFATTFDRPLSELQSPPDLIAFLDLESTSPFSVTDHDRKAVRDLLRYGGFKPTGRSKPASEYLVKAASEDRLSSINLAVDICNVVSLHSGLPISLVDLDLVSLPLRIEIADSGVSYVFNPSGQTIDIGDLLCLFDVVGPCANGVKDSQRTKTNEQTTRTLSIVWGTKQIAGRAEQVESWYRQWLQSTGAITEDVQCQWRCAIGITIYADHPNNQFFSP